MDATNDSRSHHLDDGARSNRNGSTVEPSGPTRPFFIAAANGLRVVVWNHGGEFRVGEVKLGRLVLKTITAELADRRFDSIATVEEAVSRALEA